MPHKVLVPFELPDAEPVPPAIIDALTTSNGVLLGHYNLPEQTPRAAGREQFEEDASTELAELARPFKRAGVPITTQLVFGKARAATIDRVALEEDCDVILTPGSAEAIERVLVPLRGEENFDRILSFVRELLETTDARATLLHITEDSDRRSGEEILADATEWLANNGVAPERITQEIAASGNPRQEIVDAATSFDVLVLGETEPSLRDRIFGTVPAQVTATADVPAFVVRKIEE